MSGEVDLDEFECPECLKLNSKLSNRVFKSITINDRTDEQEVNNETNQSNESEISVIELSSSDEQIECQFNSSDSDNGKSTKKCLNSQLITDDTQR